MPRLLQPPMSPPSQAFRNSGLASEYRFWLKSANAWLSTSAMLCSWIGCPAPPCAAFDSTAIATVAIWLVLGFGFEELELPSCAGPGSAGSCCDVVVAPSDAVCDWLAGCGPKIRPATNAATRSTATPATQAQTGTRPAILPAPKVPAPPALSGTVTGRTTGGGTYTTASRS